MIFCLKYKRFDETSISKKDDVSFLNVETLLDYSCKHNIPSSIKFYDLETRLCCFLARSWMFITDLEDVWCCFNPHQKEWYFGRMMLITDANEILIGLQHLLIGRYQLLNIFVCGSKLLGMLKCPKPLLFCNIDNVYDNNNKHF